MRALIYAALLILPVALLTVFALNTSRRATEDAGAANSPAQQAEPERVAASAQPENRPENKQEAARAAEPEARPEAKAEKEQAREARRAKKGRQEAEGEFTATTGLKWV